MSTPTHKLSGKNVLVTAGAQGIGEAITRHLIRAGANVAIHYFSSATTADDLVAFAKTAGGTAVAIQGDLTEETEAESVVTQAAEALGGLDILVNNAGSLVERKTLSELDGAFWHKVMDINMTSMHFVTRAAAPHLTKHDNSSIVNLASLAGARADTPVRWPTPPVRAPSSRSRARSPQSSAGRASASTRWPRGSSSARPFTTRTPPRSRPPRPWLGFPSRAPATPTTWHGRCATWPRSTTGLSPGLRSISTVGCIICRASHHAPGGF